MRLKGWWELDNRSETYHMCGAILNRWNQRLKDRLELQDIIKNFGK